LLAAVDAFGGIAVAEDAICAVLLVGIADDSGSIGLHSHSQAHIAQ
jgi:hypothetical protein